MFQLRRGLAVIGMTLGLGAGLTGCSSGSIAPRVGGPASDPASRHAGPPSGYASYVGPAAIPVVTVNTVRGTTGYARGAGGARAVPARRASGGC